MSLPPFHLRRWAAWAPGRESPSAWRDWVTGRAQSADAPAGPAAAPVPMLLRRRVGALGQQALRAAWGLPESAEARLIFSSRHGEFPRTLSILDALERGEGVSPADFTLSVHHALAGLLSIARHNRRGHTAVAAGRESFGFGMIEALACLAEQPDEPVMLVHYDEPLPAPYADFNDAEDGPLAVALVLARGGEGARMSLSAEPASAVAAAPLLPQDFLRCLLGDAGDATSHGDRMVWHWRRHGPAA